MQKKYFFLGNFYFLRKKTVFRAIFDFLRPAFGHGRVGHPQSLEYFLALLIKAGLSMAVVTKLFANQYYLEELSNKKKM